MPDFRTVVNGHTHLVIEPETGRCLGGFGSSFYRSWVFPFYTPSGHTVLQEFPFDHPFHNGFFVGQHPVIVGNRQANYWVTPPRRSHTDSVYVHVGRMDASPEMEIAPGSHGVRATWRIIWRDEKERRSGYGCPCRGRRA